MKLVVVESPAKAKTIGKYLGEDFLVKASMGHVRDLPPKSMGVNVTQNFEPEYVNSPSRTKVINELKAAAKKCDGVILAPDPDREGEAIAWHLFELLREIVPPEKFSRVTYNEITKSAIQAAFANPGQIDMQRVNSQQARRVLDRLVGFKVSPLLWKQIKGGVSAGRVQSVALRLVCEREDEIEKFTPEEFWVLGAKVRKQSEPLDPFEVKLAQINGRKAEVKNAGEAGEIKAALERSRLTVARVIEKELQRKARAPFITSSLQQAASSVYGFSPSRTMSIAQSLYENGLITYMRTDSFHIAQSAQEACRSFIGTEYGGEYLPGKPNVYKSRGNAQEAHEAIRPTEVTQTPLGTSGLKAEEQKLYKLIWERFVASQMVPAKIARRTAEIETDGPDTYLFRATVSEIRFPGYMRASGIEKPADKKNDGEEDEETEETALPPLREGELLDCLEWLGEQKFTKPPARYSEPSLIRVLEENGVGRPSTYAQTLAVLEKRSYVAKEKRALVPTEAGRRVNQFLVRTLDPLFNVKFTAEMESKLDQIEEGSVEWVDMMEGFYKQLLVWLEGARELADPDETARMIAALEQIRQWSEPIKRGRKTYDDREIVKSVRERFEADGKITRRQQQMLFQLACKYMDQFDAEQIEELGLEKPEAPRTETQQKLELLESVEFEPARKTGRRTYDDAKFFNSLRQQVYNGRRLSDRQVAALDAILLKYGDQIENFEQVKSSFNIEQPDAPDADLTGKMIELLGHVKEWNPPVLRGSMEFNDRTFFESLEGQYRSKGNLSPRQIAALRKIIARYTDQIPDYDSLQKQYGLPEPLAKKK